MGAVFYNDCLYIAHNSTLITHEYRQKLGDVDDSLRNAVGLLDMIPRLRILGEKCLMVHVEEQKGLLADYVLRMSIDTGDDEVDGNVGGSGSSSSGGAVDDLMSSNLLAGGLQRLGSGLVKAAVDVRRGRARNLSSSARDRESNDEEGAVLAVKHLERLSNQWHGVLQDAVYDRLMGFLLDAVLRGTMIPLLSAECIAEAAATDVSKVLRALQQARYVDWTPCTFPFNGGAGWMR
jgi:hypothetical protein